jgi:hypothetical protein
MGTSAFTGVKYAGVGSIYIKATATGYTSTCSSLISIYRLIGIETPTSTNSGSTTVASLTWSHTIGTNNNRLLVVGTSIPGSVAVSTVTYGGVALTKYSQVLSSGASAELWYLKNPAIGTANIVFTATTSKKLSAGAISYYNVDSSSATPFGTAVTGTGSYAGSWSIDSGTDKRIVDIAMAVVSVSTGDTVAPNLYTNETSLWLTRTSGNPGGTRSTSASSINTNNETYGNLAWSAGTGDVWSHIIVPIQPSGQ